MKKPIIYLTSAVLVSGAALGALTGCGGGSVKLEYHYYSSEVD